MSANALDLSKLPAPAAIETLAYDDIVNQRKADLISRKPSLAPVLEHDGESLVKLLQDESYREVLLRNRINQAALSTTLAFSHGADLDVAASNLGVARLEGESDEDLRDRAVLAPESWSSAGPENAYRFHARSADPRVADVGVSSPSPGVVRIVVLSSALDGVATPDLIQVVSVALSAKTVRPLTDKVEVTSARVASYDIEAVLKVPPGPDPDVLVAAASAAARAYGARQRKIDKGIVLKAITTALMPAGVEDLDLIQPLADIAADDETAPVLGSVTLSIEIMT